MVSREPNTMTAAQATVSHISITVSVLPPPFSSTSFFFLFSLSLSLAHSFLSLQTIPPAYIEQRMLKLPNNYNFLKGKTSNTSEQSFTLPPQAFEVSRDHLKTWKRGASSQSKIALTEPSQCETHPKCENVKNISC